MSALIAVYVGQKCLGTFGTVTRAERFISSHVAEGIAPRVSVSDVYNRIAPSALVAQGKRGNRQRERIPSFNLDVGVY